MSHSTLFANFIRKGLLPLIVMLIVLGMTVPAMAIPTIFGVTGEVTSVSGALAGGPISVGDSLSLLYTFESTTAPVPGSTSTFGDFNALSNFDLTIGGYSASSAAPEVIRVINNNGGFDNYQVESRASNGLTGPDINGNSLFLFSSTLRDFSETVFSDALILPTSLSLSDFDNRSFFLEFGGQGGPFVSGTIKGLSAPIPEPSTLLLLGSGLVGLGVWRLRKRAK